MTKDRLLKKQYLKYIIPSITAQVVFTAYTMVDGIFVARGVSETALAAVTIAMPYVNMLWALSITFAAGTSAVASRLMGEGNLAKACKIFSRNMATMLLIGLSVTAFTFLGMDPLCNFLGATDATRELVKDYIGTIAPFAVVFLASYTLEILTATDGYPSKATLIVSLGVLANIVLDYIFIFVWHKGVFGAAIATALSQVCVIIVYLCHFLGPKSHIKFCRFGSLRGVLKDLSKGIGSGVNELSPGLITFIYVHAVQNYLTEDKLVTNSVIQYVLVVVLIMGIGVAQGSQPLLSFYNGKGEKAKVRTLMKYQAITTTLLQVFAVALIIVFAGPITKVFISSDQALIEYTMWALRIAIVSGLVVGYNMVFTSYFTAMEKPLQGMVISLSRSSVFLFSGIWIMASLLGGNGIWWGMCVAEVLTVVTAVILYKGDGPFCNFRQKGAR